MNNFMQMRQNMIAGQFLPGLIKNEKILAVLKGDGTYLLLPILIFRSLYAND